MKERTTINGEERPLTVADLPGLDCGQCGVPTCSAFAERLASKPELLVRCIHSSANRRIAASCSSCATQCVPLHAAGKAARCRAAVPDAQASPYRDSLGRPFDFFLEHFPEDPGPRETILPHNPILTRELAVQVNDVLIGRPLGMSCGCPVTHCGIVRDVDLRTGVIVWCVTGPLQTRQNGFKDLGYYTAEAYEGLITEAQVEVRIGERYFFQPRMCMLQWRHSGLVNYLNRTSSSLQVRLEGLWIG